MSDKLVFLGASETHKVLVFGDASGQIHLISFEMWRSLRSIVIAERFDMSGAKLVSGKTTTVTLPVMGKYDRLFWDPENTGRAIPVSFKNIQVPLRQFAYGIVAGFTNYDKRPLWFVPAAQVAARDTYLALAAEPLAA